MNTALFKGNIVDFVKTIILNYSQDTKYKEMFQIISLN